MFAFCEKARVVGEAITFLLTFLNYLLGYLPGEIMQLFVFILFCIKTSKSNKSC